MRVVLTHIFGIMFVFRLFGEMFFSSEVMKKLVRNIIHPPLRIKSPPENGNGT